MSNKRIRRKKLRRALEYLRYSIRANAVRGRAAAAEIGLNTARAPGLDDVVECARGPRRRIR